MGPAGTAATTLCCTYLDSEAEDKGSVNMSCLAIAAYIAAFLGSLIQWKIIYTKLMCSVAC